MRSMHRRSCRGRAMSRAMLDKCWLIETGSTCGSRRAWTSKPATRTDTARSSTAEGPVAYQQVPAGRPRPDWIGICRTTPRLGRMDLCQSALALAEHKILGSPAFAERDSFAPPGLMVSYGSLFETDDPVRRPTCASHPDIVSSATASSSSRLAPSRAWSDMPFCTVSTKRVSA